MEYRYDPTENIWHFCRSCSKWPSEPFTVLYLDKPPTLLKLCPKCLTLTFTVALTDPPKTTRTISVSDKPLSR